MPSTESPSGCGEPPVSVISPAVVNALARLTGKRYRRLPLVALYVGDKRRWMVASLRYIDTFVKIDDAWFFAEPLLYVDWIDERPLP